jgi:hypothetical protein
MTADETIASFTVVLAIATIALVIATFIMAKHTKTLATEAKLARVKQETPEIVITIEPNKNVTCLDLVIENTGDSLACNLDISIVDETNCTTGKLNDKKFLKLEKLKAQQKRVVFIGTYLDLKPKIITFQIEYKNSKGKLYKDRQIVDVGNMEGICITGQNVDMEISNSLKKLAADINKIGGGHSKIRVDSFNSRDRENEQEKNMKWIENNKSKQKAQN